MLHYNTVYYIYYIIYILYIYIYLKFRKITELCTLGIIMQKYSGTKQKYSEIIWKLPFTVVILKVEFIYANRSR